MEAGDGRAPGLARRVAWPTATAVGVTAATALLAVRTPYAPGSYGICPVLALTGMLCPACGGLRAVHELTQLDIAAAWAMNPLVLLGLPVAVVVWAVWLLRSGWGRPRLPRLPAATPWVVLAVVMAFGVLRNVPVLAPWLGP